jgi:hypothetical protein
MAGKCTARFFSDDPLIFAHLSASKMERAGRLSAVVHQSGSSTRKGGSSVRASLERPSNKGRLTLNFQKLSYSVPSAQKLAEGQSHRLNVDGPLPVDLDTQTYPVPVGSLKGAKAAVPAFSPGEAKIGRGGGRTLIARWDWSSFAFLPKISVRLRFGNTAIGRRVGRWASRCRNRGIASFPECPRRVYRARSPAREVRRMGRR